MNTENALYNAFKQAETGGVPDPWIRTMAVPKGGSTAYGPVQITRTLAEDYLKRHKDLFNTEEIAYLERFIEQGRLFAKYGREPDKPGYDPRYEYGGSGDLTSSEDKAVYERVAKKMLMQHYKNNKGNLEDTIKEWRFGASSSKGRQNDERYYEEIENTFISQPDEPETQEQQTPFSDLAVGFLENLNEYIAANVQRPQSASQEATEGNTQPEEEQPISSDDSMAEPAFTEEEERLIQSAVSAPMQEESVEEGEEGEEVQFTAAEESLIARASGTRETQPPVRAEKREEPTDGDKDPIFGIF